MKKLMIVFSSMALVAGGVVVGGVVTQKVDPARVVVPQVDINQVKCFKKINTVSTEVGEVERVKKALEKVYSALYEYSDVAFQETARRLDKVEKSEYRKIYTQIVKLFENAFELLPFLMSENQDPVVIQAKVLEIQQVVMPLLPTLQAIQAASAQRSPAEKEYVAKKVKEISVRFLAGMKDNLKHFDA